MWLIFSLLSAFFFALSSFFIKKSIHDTDPMALSIFWGMLSGIIYLPFIVPILTPTMILAIAIWTLVRAFGFYPYKYVDLSLRDPLSSSQILFVFLMSLFILGEPFSLSKLFGTLLMIAAVIVLTASKGKASWTGIFSTILIAGIMSIGAIIDKININAGIPVFHYMFVIFFIPSLILTPFKMKALKACARVKTIYPSAIFFSLGYLFLLLAYQIQDASIVYPISWFSIVISVLLGSIVLKEGNLLRRLMASGIAVLGIWLLAK